MELYKEILTNILSNEKINITFIGLEMDATEIVETECYKTLLKIKYVIDDISLNDIESYISIKETINSLKGLGINFYHRFNF